MGYKYNITKISSLKELAKSMAEETTSIGWGRFFLKGDLGSGKTTFVRFFVENIKGAENAEVSSPSFNLFNIYPTEPEIIHIDLYRCMDLEEEVLEYISMDENIVFVEWCDRLPCIYWPHDHVLMEFKISESNRTVEIFPKGEKFKKLLKGVE